MTVEWHVHKSTINDILSSTILNKNHKKKFEKNPNIWKLSNIVMLVREDIK